MRALTQGRKGEKAKDSLLFNGRFYEDILILDF